MGEVVSDWKEVSSGVPQGYVLGPLLIVFYINDLIDFIKNILKLYADDGKLYAILDETVDEHKSMQDDIYEISKWCYTWTMEINAKKCAVTHYGKNNTKRDYMVTDFLTREKLSLSSSSIERGLDILVS